MSDTEQKLTMKQEAFVVAYLQNGFNATKAAKTAGYSVDTAYSIGHENLSKPEIAKAIHERLDSEGITCDKIKIGIAKVAFGADLADFEPLSTGTTLTALRDSGVDTRMVKKITTRHEVGSDEKLYTVTSLELHDSQSAFDKLAKVHGMYHENLDVTTDGQALNDYPGLTPAMSKKLAEVEDGPE